MKLLKKIDCQEYKSQILLLISLIIFSFIIYSLVLSPFQNYLQKRERVSSLEIKTRKEMKQNQANNQRYKKLLEELEETEKYYSNLEEKTKKKSFKNVSSFEKFISEKSNFYNLTIETIGRVEKISETDKIYIPYIISGDISDIFLFIEELENSDKKITKIKYLNFNNRIYIIVNYKNNSKNIFYVGEEIVFDNSKYRIILENNYPFLQQIKN